MSLEEVMTVMESVKDRRKVVHFRTQVMWYSSVGELTDSCLPSDSDLSWTTYDFCTHIRIQ